MSGITRLLSRFGALYYVQIWERKLKVTEAHSGRVHEEAPLVAIRANEKGEKVIHAVGNNAKLAAGPELTVVNPFSHPRLLLSEFVVGERLLAYFFQKFHEGKWLLPSPIIVIHPMEKTEGGLTGVERRAFRELAVGAGAREVFVHEGSELSVQELRERSFEEKEELIELPLKNERNWSLLFILAALVLVVVYAVLSKE